MRNKLTDVWLYLAVDTREDGRHVHFLERLQKLHVHCGESVRSRLFQQQRLRWDDFVLCWSCYKGCLGRYSTARYEWSLSVVYVLKTFFLLPLMSLIFLRRTKGWSWALHHWFLLIATNLVSVCAFLGYFRFMQWRSSINLPIWDIA